MASPHRSLLCEEDSASLEDAHADPLPFAFSKTSRCDDDHIEHLLSCESSYIHRSHAAPNEWQDSARRDAVRWIVKKSEHLGFAFQTAYLAVAYLDRFLLRRTIENRQIWAVKLLSIACLTLAAKLEECHVPDLSYFEFDEYHFDGRSIQRMELIILNTLDWRLRLVTPFPFISYLISKFVSNLPPREVFQSATETILSAVDSINSLDYLPSSLAVSAFFVATERSLTEQALLSDVGLILPNGSSRAQQVLSCYSRIQELLETKIATICARRDQRSDLSSIISRKRRRVSLDSFNCHCIICNKEAWD